MLYLFGKSAAEVVIAKSVMMEGNGVSLPDDGEVKVVLSSDDERPCSEGRFRVDEFLKCLSAKRFGRFVVWSPRLPSTHDVVSQ